MRINALRRHFIEGFKNIQRHGWMSIVSIVSVAATLTALGMFYMLYFNLNQMTRQIEEQIQIHVFLETGDEPTDIDRVRTEIGAIDGVDSVKYVSKEEEFVDFKQNFSHLSLLLEELEMDNPLPDSMIVGVSDPKNIAEIVEAMKEMPEIAEVEYGQAMIDRWFSSVDVVKRIGLFFSVALTILSILIIANTVKATIMARKEELEVMKLAGATNGFIRWPLFIEGMLLSLIGILFSIVIIAFFYSFVAKRVYFNLFIEMLPLTPLLYQVCLLLVGLGLLIGLWGSFITIKRFLKI